MHVYIIAQVRQKTTTTRQREPSESGQCFVFQFSIQSLTASQQPFYSFSLLFAEGTGPPQKKAPPAGRICRAGGECINVSGWVIPIPDLL